MTDLIIFRDSTGAFAHMFRASMALDLTPLEGIVLKYMNGADTTYLRMPC